ncbi:hypothetical protein [Parabacteroides sp. FAFU027]|uniref:hypothetical protein n=1 Tax=Parabacteroides sp. FAFU027 TaxID=2922715 RepID=UPI001FAFB500|nr:hypothetical protein [Parabacteroides sp. FAFU027]
MSGIFFISFLTGLMKGALLIAVGLLISRYFETLLGVIRRKQEPEETPDNYQYHKMISLIKIIGYIIMLMGVINLLLVMITLIFMNGHGMGNMHLNL